MIRKPKGSPKEAIKTLRAEIPTIFALLFWYKRCHQKDILKLTDLYFKDLLKNYTEVQPVEEENYEKLSVMFQKGELKVSPVQMQSVELMLKNYLEAYKRLACLK